MNIIFVTKRSRSTTSFTLSHAGIWVSGLLVFVLLLGVSLMYFGYQLGEAHSESMHKETAQAEHLEEGNSGSIQTVVVDDAEQAKLRAELRSERAEIEEARRWINDNLRVVAVRVGALQARVVRMEALGKRMVERSGMEKGEFDFSRRPPQGGSGAKEGIEENIDLTQLSDSIDELLGRLDDREQQLSILEMLLEGKSLNDAMIPSGRPVKSGWVSSSYGRRTDPKSGRRAMHHGIDYAGRTGSPIKSVAAGVVSRAGSAGSYGLLIEIDHGNGYTTRYAHNKKLLVKPGQIVKRGDNIALLGNTGKSTGPHLHFEVRKNGHTVNPRSYVLGKK